MNTDLGARVGNDTPLNTSDSKITNFIGKLNPWWNDPNPDSTSRFKEAVEMVGKGSFSHFSQIMKFHNFS